MQEDLLTLELSCFIKIYVLTKNRKGMIEKWNLEKDQQEFSLCTTDMYSDNTSMNNFM